MIFSFQKSRWAVLLSITFFFCSRSALFAQEVIPDARAQVDETVKLIVCNGLPSGTPSNLQIRGKLFALPTVSEFSYGKKYTVTNGGQSYALYFTELPLLVVANLNEGAITRDGSDIVGDMTLRDVVNGYDHGHRAGLRIRGNTSVNFPKKSYRMQTKRPDNDAQNLNVSLLGLRNDRRWLLLALWNEELKLVNQVSHKLWISMHKLPFMESAGGTDLPLASIRTRFVDVFINSSYKGVYLMAEDMDEKQLGLQASGELYKGDTESPETNFSGNATPTDPEGANGSTYSGFEMRYKGGSRWANLHSLLSMAVNPSNSTFASNIGNLISIPSCMDYYIYINVMMAVDNHQKNYFLAKYQSGDPYFFAPWDLDGTWGYTTTGMRQNKYNDIITNGLFTRLLSVNPNNFKVNLAQRWFSLRNNLLSSSALISSFNSEFDYLQSNGVYERDILVADDEYSQNGRASALDYVRTFIARRMIVLDNYFGAMLPAANCDFALNATIPNDVVLKGSPITLNGSCAGPDCGSATFYWWNDKGWSSNGLTASTTAPSQTGVSGYYLAASKNGCPTKNLPMAVVTNNDGSTTMDVTFGFYGTGGVGYRDFLSYINNNGKVNLRQLNGLNPSYFMHIENGQELSERNSNFFDHVELRLYRNGGSLTGWGPEFIGGSEGPYGLSGKYGTYPLPVGTGYRLVGSAYRGGTLLATKSANFEIIDEAPLPVTLENFTAKLNSEKRTQLNWRTSAEKSFEGFEVERSETGLSWNKIGFMSAKGGEGSTGDYTFLDPEKASVMTYYRLRMVDLDGAYEYSRIVILKAELLDSYVFYDQTEKAVYLNNCPDLQYLELINAMGVVLETRDGNSSKSMSLRGLQPGIYFVRYKTTLGGVGNEKILHID